MAKLIIGIDPGAKGAIAVLSGATILDLMPMPWLEKVGIHGTALRAFLEEYDSGHAYIEELGQRRGEGAVSGKTAAKQWGRIQGQLEGLQIQYTVVRPQKWRAAMDCTIPSGGNPKDRSRLLKARSVARAGQLWPTQNFKRTEKCKGPSDGMCEAALIAEYGRRTLNAI